MKLAGGIQSYIRPSFGFVFVSPGLCTPPTIVIAEFGSLGTDGGTGDVTGGAAAVTFASRKSPLAFHHRSSGGWNLKGQLEAPP